MYYEHKDKFNTLIPRSMKSIGKRKTEEMISKNIGENMSPNPF